MKAFNIIKPDMIEDEESTKYYFSFLKNEMKIDTITQYKINDWVSLSKKLYEMDLINGDDTIENIVMRRKQLLTTILGYYMCFNNKYATANVFDIGITNIELKLNQLSKFKKILRKKYVYDTDKYYLKILNMSDIDLENSLEQINLGLIKSDLVTLPANTEFNEENYNMIFFNKIHFPDPDIEKIKSELNLLNENGVFNKSNFMRKLKI